MSAATKATAAPFMLHLGEGASQQSFEIRPLNIDILTQMEAWIEEQMWAAHRRSRRYLPPEEYDRNASKVIEVIASGKFTFPQAGFIQALFSLPGLQHAVYLALRDRYPDVDEEMAERLVNENLERLSHDLLSTPDPDPSVGTPTTEQAAIPLD